MTKKSVLVASGVAGGLFVISLLALLYNFCGPYRGTCKDVYEFIVYPFSPFPFVFLLSLITYKMPDQVFQAWWKVAKWFVPIIVVITFLTNYGHQQSGFGGVAQGAFSFAFLFLLYAAFIIMALIRIFFAYRKIKQGNV